MLVSFCPSSPDTGAQLEQIILRGRSLRVLFFLLLVANLALAGWQLLAPPAPSNAAVPREGGKRIRLLSEMEPQALTPLPAPRTERRMASCYRLGPLALQQGTAQALQAQLEARGHAVQVSRQEQLQPLGWWVYLPPAASLQEAQMLSIRLTERGVTDHVLVAGAEKANAISLGLYTERYEAERRINELRVLGFQPLLEQRYERRLLVSFFVRAKDAEPEPIDGYTWQPVDCQGGVY